MLLFLIILSTQPDLISFPVLQVSLSCNSSVKLCLDPHNTPEKAKIKLENCKLASRKNQAILLV